MILVLLAGCFGEYEQVEQPPIVDDAHPCAGVETGPWSGHPLADVRVRTSFYTHDAGLDAVFASMPAEGESVSVDLPVTDAIVTNVGFEGEAGRSLWIADGSGGMRTFAVAGLDGYAPGDGIAFRVTEITNYFGEIEITAITDDERTTTDNAVHVFSAGEAAFDFPDDRGLNAEFAGLVIGESSDDCGDNPCLEIDNGVVTQTIDLRDSFPGELVYDETCVHILAPVEFRRGDLRLGGSDVDWMQAY